MRIITTRRISQIFFFTLFMWFCVAGTLGERWWQLRGWPINWLLQLDPLNGLGILLATHTLYAGLLWGVLTIAMTLVLGRFFCGWLCPFGTLQQWVGHLGKRGLKTAARLARNRPHPAQRIKYWLLLFLLAAAAADLLHYLFQTAHQAAFLFWSVTAIAALLIAGLHRYQWLRARRDTTVAAVCVLALGWMAQLLFPHSHWLATSLQTGLFDPIALMHRSVNLVLLPLLDQPLKALSALPRLYPGAMVIGALFALLTLLSLLIPRFYCRFVCPLGALLGLLSRWSLWRIGKTNLACKRCHHCERDCEGACAPVTTIKINECVLCLNCLDQCRHDVMGYHLAPSAAGEQTTPDLTRRQVITALVTGLAAAPALRLEGQTGANWNPAVIRPPGALAEADFLSRCIKCGQCMRVCPTQVIHPAGLQSGFEGLWTPLLNFRGGSSGCQHSCVACGQFCPTAALRPMTVNERMGQDAYAQSGPVRIGTAFVDRGRCLPWAMDTPCIVCQENCPVSPKAIFTRDAMQPVRDGQWRVETQRGEELVLKDAALLPGQYATGDYFCRWSDEAPKPITANSRDTLLLGPQPQWPQALGPGDTVEIILRLQQPYVNPSHCIGCGVCEHECPVQGHRAIRVTAENESRHPEHRMMLELNIP
jgi:polyferredoxin